MAQALVLQAKTQNNNNNNNNFNVYNTAPFNMLHIKHTDNKRKKINIKYNSGFIAGSV